MSLDFFAPIATAPETAGYLSSAILLLAVAAFAVLRLRLAPLLEELGRVRVTLETLPKESAALAQQLSTLDSQLGASPRLGPSWRAYRATLVPLGDAVYAPREATPFFSVNRLLAQQVNLRFYQAMPNLLVGMGILGTFVGLLFGIHVASRGLASPDINVARAALQGLLSAAALKFATSVAGLLASLLFSWGEKHTTHQLDRLIGRFVETLEERVTRVTPESLALRQEALLRELPGRIGAALETRLAPLLNRSGENLRSASGEAVQDLAETFKNGGEGLRREVAEQLTLMLARLSTAVETVSGQLANAGARAATDLDRAAGGVSAAGNRMEQATGATARLTVDVERILVGLRDAQAGFQGVAGPVVEAASAFRSSGIRVESAAGRIQEAASGLQGAVAELARLEAQVCGQWREYEERFAHVDASLAATFRELDQGLTRYTGTVRDWVEGLDRHAANIAKDLGGAAGEIRETVAELAGVLAENRS